MAVSPDDEPVQGSQCSRQDQHDQNQCGESTLGDGMTDLTDGRIGERIAKDHGNQHNNQTRREDGVDRPSVSIDQGREHILFFLYSR